MEYIEFQNVSKQFGSQLVLSDIRLSVKKGELVSLLGPSGCGKSTLLRCLAGLEGPTAGDIYIDGINVTKKLPRDRGVGMVFQQYSLFPNMTVAQNIEYGLRMLRLPKEQRRLKVRSILEIIDMQDSENKKPYQLSAECSSGPLWQGRWSQRQRFSFSTSL
jgi:putative spermidine/putrescine transport system ATP-binding protein